MTKRISEFTFVSFTYNQERYIDIHLKSILYQIKNYGAGIKITYILCDDCSKDSTVQIVKDWVQKNQELLHRCEFVVSNENGGIVHNYTNALKSIKTEQFCILSGDDFLYKTNIFDVWDGNLVISPSVTYDGKEAAYANNEITFELLIGKQRGWDLRRILINRLKLHMHPFATSMYYSMELVTDKLYEELGKYKWIEDYPKNVIIFNDPNLRVNVISSPLTIYRIESGISTSEESEHRKAFKREEEEILRTVCVHYKKNIYINPYQYMFHFQKKFEELFLYKANKEVEIIKKDSRLINNQLAEYMTDLETNY